MVNKGIVLLVLPEYVGHCKHSQKEEVCRQQHIDVLFGKYLQDII